jgi:hypothetical protein
MIIVYARDWYVHNPLIQSYFNKIRERSFHAKSFWKHSQPYIRGHLASVLHLIYVFVKRSTLCMELSAQFIKLSARFVNLSARYNF